MKQLRDNIWYVGIQNPGLRSFDIIMRTEYGTSYNSYVIKGEKYALIEAAHSSYGDEFLEEISAVTPVESIDYIILNHTEPDHSGSLIRILEKNPEVLVIGTVAAIRNIAAITNMEFKSRIVKDKDQLDLGNGVVLDFIVAPNLHWPDSMFTYYEKGKVLFSCDFFGAHYCEPLIFDRYIKKKERFITEQKNYFDCIFGPFKTFVAAGLKKLEGKEIEMVCNSHGPVLTETIADTMERYREWSEPDKKERNVAIFFASAYGYTRVMAEALAEGVREAGLTAEVYDIEDWPLEVLAQKMNRAGGVMFGSCTINRAVVSPIITLIAMTEAINLKGKPAMAFGSYGWSGEACGQICDVLNTFKYKVYNDGIKVVFKPGETELDSLKAAGREFASAI